jgi:hypothetical protein
MKRAMLLFGLLAIFASNARGDILKMVLNEWNCVSPAKFMKDAAGTDPFFGRVLGNGDNWVEFAVLQDHLDIRGWTVNWDNRKDNGDTDSGTMAFTNNPIWSDLRQGTIIGLREYDSAGGDHARPSDLSYNPFADDWTIYADMDDAALITKDHWKVDNDRWKATLLDAGGQTVEGYAGEKDSGALYMTTGGINSQEIGALGNGPNVDSSQLTYNIHGTSTFLAPNSGQDFTALRNAVIPEPGILALMLSGTMAAWGAALFRGERTRR